MQTGSIFLVLTLPFLVVTAYGQDTLQPPVTYDGITPCADCPGIRNTLTLFKDGMFILRRTYFKNVYSPNSSYDLGRWSIDGQNLVLKTRPGTPQKFATLAKNQAIEITEGLAEYRKLSRKAVHLGGAK